jgi:hypothetical protein
MRARFGGRPLVPLLFVVLAASPVTAPAQRAPRAALAGRVPIGARVRLTLFDARREEGQFEAVDSVAILLRPVGAATVARRHELSGVRALEVYRPGGDRGARGAAGFFLGALGGAVVGGGVGYVVTKDGVEDKGIGAVLGAPVGALIGGLLGLGAGLESARERWEPVPLPGR